MASNERTRKIYEYVAVSGAGKKQSGLGAFQPNADLDTRDNCTVTITENVNRRDEYFCDGRDLRAEPILNRDVQIVLDYPNGFTPQILARWQAYKEGVAGAPSGSTANEVQTLTRSGTVSGGTFTITLVHEGKTGVTEAIAYDASNATILAALLKKTGTATAMGKLLRSGDVTVGGTWGTAITLTFAGRFAGANMAAVTIDATSLTGSTPGIDVATTTAGSQKTHAISRSTDGTLPLFSLITGDKNEAYDHFKYGDCAVNDIALNFSQEAGAVVGLTVTIYGNYVAEREDSSYDVPACANLTAVKTEDCKLKIDSTWEQNDIASLSFTSSNNIPRDAAFGYDDIDVTVAYQSGDIPTQGWTFSMYGSPDTALYQLAEAEATSGNEVEFIMYIGQAGNRMEYNCGDAKIMFQSQREGTAGPLQQKTFNLIATPHTSPPMTMTYYGSESTTFLTASS